MQMPLSYFMQNANGLVQSLIGYNSFGKYHHSNNLKQKPTQSILHAGIILVPQRNRFPCRPQ